MKTIFFLLLLQTSIIESAFAQGPTVSWNKTYGGGNLDQSHDIIQTLDGGYLVVGETYSNNGNVYFQYGKVDLWVIKLNDSGSIEWSKTFGGKEYDIACSVLQTKDSSYIIAGNSNSKDGVIKYPLPLKNAWIIKLNTKGELQWEKTLGGSGGESANDIIQLANGDMVFAGSTTSAGGDVSVNKGENDFWIVKIDSLGSILWEKTYGGSGSDYAYSIKVTPDFGFIVVGCSASTDGDVLSSKGLLDMWIIKLDSLGAMQWQKTIGGSKNDEAHDVVVTKDGGCLVTGFSESKDGDIITHTSFSIGWLVKLNKDGLIDWQVPVKEGTNDYLYSVIEAKEGGYIFAGTQYNNVASIFKYQNVLVEKVDETGKKVWSKIMGGAGGEIAKSIKQTNDQGFIVCGRSSSKDGHLIKNYGSDDVWVIKLSKDFLSIKESELPQSEVKVRIIENGSQLQISEILKDVSFFDIMGRKFKIDMIEPKLFDIHYLPSSTYILIGVDSKGLEFRYKFYKN